MIIKSKAVEPKASSATSIYPAIIIKINDLDVSNAFVYLQVFCPDVMAGTILDSKFSSCNWISAPKGPHDGVAYDFQVGGLVMISYQDGNINTPQFVRYVTIKPDIIERNAEYINNNIPITTDSNIFDITDTSINTLTTGLQKGLALLPALKACSISDIFHTYGYDSKGLGTDLEGQQYLTIYRFGRYCTELIFRNSSDSLINYGVNKDNFSYLDNQNGTNTWLNICRRLLAVDDSTIPGHSLIDIVNDTIIEFEDKDEYSKPVFDKTNVADKLYWYTKLAGYIYAVGDKYDSSNLIAPSLTDKVSKEELKISKPQVQSKTWQVLHYTNNYTAADYMITLYRGTFRTDNSTEYVRNLVFDFVNKLFKNINKNTFFNEQLATAYTVELNNILFSLKQTYSVDITANKMLMICSVIAIAFPAIQNCILNFDLMDNKTFTEDVKDFTLNIKACLRDSTKKLPDEKTIANKFTLMYFQSLGGWLVKETENKPHCDASFKWIDNPAEKIYDQMLAGIQYINNNYSSINSILVDNSQSEFIGGNGKPSQYGFVWPIPGVTNITSNFGWRTHPITGKQSYHTGVDISSRTCYNKPVIATADGKVINVVNKYAEGDGNGYGNYVYIEHDSKGTRSRYAHLLKAVVTKNSTVKQGQVIGYCDNTGSSTGNHLHFEIILSGSVVDPLKYVAPDNTINTNSETGKYYNVKLSHDIQDYLFAQCNSRGIPTALMIALIDQESGFNPNSIGKNSNGTQDEGLCQLNNAYSGTWAKELGITNFNVFDPKQNIRIGCYVFGSYINQCGTTITGMHKALTSYNRGAGGATEWYKKYGTYITPYSTNVMTKYEQYKR